ncbi:MAG TPA: NnrS family protein, partial [Tepidisphaeraceae bacterium]|nr:NnrS family protein [Tepidisphaeraceae bacterium]
GLVFLVAWLWIWAATDLWLRVHDRSERVLPDAARSLLIVLPVLGLATNAIYGFGIRLIPGLLNIGRLRPRWFGPALLLHNLGLCLFLVPRRIFQVVGAAFMLAGAMSYLIGMDLLRAKPSRPIYGIDPRGHVLIRVAFFWLVCGLAMILVQQFNPQWPHAYSGAWRHALTVGFITTMILGVGHRIIPIFIKQPLASTPLMLISAALIITGNAGRVTLELLTIGGWAWSYRLMGVTGILELAALMLFAINIATTAWNRRRVYTAGKPVTPDTRVQEAVNACPDIQDRLRALGITMFDTAPFIAPSMTFGALALASGMNPGELIHGIELAGAEPSVVRKRPSCRDTSVLRETATGPWPRSGEKTGVHS